MYKIKFEKLEWESPMAGVRHKLCCLDNTKIRLVEYTKKMPLHWCDKGHIGYILDGKFEIRFDHETIIYEKGDVVVIPPGKKHQHKAKVLSDIVTVFFIEKNDEE